MKVNVVGKEYVHGTSKKTGKEFEGNVVHCTHRKQGCEGLVAESIWLNPDDYPLSGIEVGKTYEVDRDQRGYIVEFSKV